MDPTGIESEKALSKAEKEALRLKQAGQPYSKKDFASAKSKLDHNEKIREERNKQKRQSNFSLEWPEYSWHEVSEWAPGGAVGTAIIACIWFLHTDSLAGSIGGFMSTNEATDRATVQTMKSWTCHHFAMSDLDSRLPDLLRRTADTLDELGQIRVLDIAVSIELTSPEPEAHVTVYYS